MAYSNSRLCAGQKGSDRSAKEATRKVVVLSRQLTALEAVLTPLGGDPALTVSMTKEEAVPQARGEGPEWTAKNIIVRDVLNEIGNRR